MGIKGGVIHFAFKAEDEADLISKQTELRNRDVDVTDVVDHGWCKSIYFSDPNSLQLEYCVITQELVEAHLEDRASDDWQQLSRV